MGAGTAGDFGNTNGSSKREELLNRSTNQKQKNAINEMYRPNAKTGDGSLGDAIRYELKKISRRKVPHKKRIERIKNLENILKKQTLNSTDKTIIKELIKDLKNALGGK